MGYKNTGMESFSSWKTFKFSGEKNFNLDGLYCLAYYWHKIYRAEIVCSKGKGVKISWVWLISILSITGYSFSKWTSGLRKISEDIRIKYTVLNYYYVRVQLDEYLIHNSALTLEWLKDKDDQFLEWSWRFLGFHTIQNLSGIVSRVVYKDWWERSSDKHWEESFVQGDK